MSFNKFMLEIGYELKIDGDIDKIARCVADNILFSDKHFRERTRLSEIIEKKVKKIIVNRRVIDEAKRQVCLNNHRSDIDDVVIGKSGDDFFFAHVYYKDGPRAIVRIHKSDILTPDYCTKE